MNLLTVSAASVALAGLPFLFSTAVADEKGKSPDSVAAGTQPTHWAAYADDDNSLLTQARAVFADLRTKLGIEARPPTVSQSVQVVAMNDEPGRYPRTGNGSEGCRFMEIPGSRIREWRCYYPNEGEKALNAYQFREEIRQNVQQSLIQDMNRTSNQVFIQETMQNPSMFTRQQ